MAWKKVDKYILGFNIQTKQFYFTYQLEGEQQFNQMQPLQPEIVALADMFRNEAPIYFNVEGNYFMTLPEQVGEGESLQAPVST